MGESWRRGEARTLFRAPAQKQNRNPPPIMPLATRKCRSLQYKQSRLSVSHPHVVADNGEHSDTGGDRQFTMEGMDDVDVIHIEGEGVIIHREEVIAAEMLYEPMKLIVEYAVALDIDEEDDAEKMEVEIEPVTPAAGLCLGETVEMIEAIGDQAPVTPSCQVQIVSSAEESEAGKVEIASVEAREAPVAPEAAYEDQLGADHRMRWWNCCGLFDLVKCLGQN